MIDAQDASSILPPRRSATRAPSASSDSSVIRLRSQNARRSTPVFRPHDLRHRRISLLHLGGVPWARIGEHVGQRDFAVTANTYSHVLADERELDYAEMLR